MQKQRFGVALTPLEKITLTAVMTALSIVLCRFLGYSPANTMFRVEIGFLPVALVGILAGPLYSGVCYGLADLIGSLVTTGMNPLILLCKIAAGLILGLFLYRRRPTLPLILLTLFVLGAGVDVFLMSAVFKVMGYAPSYASALYTRTINALINYPIRVVALYLVCLFGLPAFESALARSGARRKTAFKTYANSFQTVSRLGLERETDLLSRLGNPEKSLRCLHIAGTNGKGSVAAYLSAILTKAGCSVGLYTSPNLVRVNERIRVNGDPIGDDDLDRLLGRVEAAAKETETALHETPTQFEIWTAIAFLYFSEKTVDYVVLETGLGGEFDATNVIPGNVAAILTRIDLDHVEYLGDTVAKIA
ncbi:MAG: folate family ECF transporter S component [Clostridia bacterium]|nr:folate family ECF transporter S component [Clostridia bacterium]